MAARVEIHESRMDGGVMRMRRLDGLDLLEEIKRRDPSIPVLVISGHGTLDTAVAAIRKGAAEFIEKPFQAERLLLMVERATETERLRAEVSDEVFAQARRQFRGLEGADLLAAEAVRLYLARAGLPLPRMTTISYGESAPLADNNTRDGRSTNRRVQVIVMR